MATFDLDALVPLSSRLNRFASDLEAEGRLSEAATARAALAEYQRWMALGDPVAALAAVTAVAGLPGGVGRVVASRPDVPPVPLVRVEDAAPNVDETDPGDLRILAGWLEARGNTGAAQITRRIAAEIERDRETDAAWGRPRHGRLGAA